MKILTLNFVTCARKACKPSAASFPLHPKDAVLESVEADVNPLFLSNILPRLEWGALLSVCNELGLPGLVDSCPEREALFDDYVETGADEAMGVEREEEEQGVSEASVASKQQQQQQQRPSQLARDLHRLLIETCILDGKLVCGNCGHEYAIKEGIANFLLPPHLV